MKKTIVFARMRCNIVQRSPFAVFRWRVLCFGDHTGVLITLLGERVACSAMVVYSFPGSLQPHLRAAIDERRGKNEGGVLGRCGGRRKKIPPGPTA